jgi:hypothetical protein
MQCARLGHAGWYFTFAEARSLKPHLRRQAQRRFGRIFGIYDFPVYSHHSCGFVTVRVLVAVTVRPSL